jgi:hypothetical protein
MPKVKVNQKDGEIVVSRGGDEPVVYKVSGGEVEVKKEDEEQFRNEMGRAGLLARSESAAASAGS